MKDQLLAKEFILALLITHLLLLTSCSYFTDFVIINESSQTIQIRYKVKKSTAGPLAVSGIPATIKASQLSTHGGQEWRELATDQYKLLQEGNNEIVVVDIGPNEALRLTKLYEYGGHADPE